jgi:hypothetical protein
MPSAFICAEKEKRELGKLQPIATTIKPTPSTIELPTVVQGRDLREHLLQVHLRLLCLLTQQLNRPLLVLVEEGKEGIEQLIAGHTHHAFILALCLVLCTLRKKGGGRPAV